MPLYTADALILRTYKLGEADRIVVFLTSDRGKRRGVAKGARRTRSRFAGGLEPFTRVRLAYFERERRDLVRLSYVEPVVSPLSSRSGEGLGYASYFAELVDEWSPEGDPNDRVYRLGASVVSALATDAPADAVARYFEYWLLRLQGVYPSLRTCHQCGGALTRDGAVLSHPAGVFVCAGCGAGEAGVDLLPDAIEYLQRASTRPPERLGDLTLTRRVGRQLAATHRALIAAHLDKELRSVRVLRAIDTGGALDPPRESGSP